jgi:diaminobutyrate-2-oxoglutarate transaminase
MTQGALAVTADLRVRRAGLRVRDDVTFLPFPYPFRSRTKNVETLTEQCLDHMQMLLEDDQSGVDRPGVVLIEAMQGEGGNIPAPPRFLQGIRQLCDAHGILLAVDEIQAGMGRTGRWFAFEHAGIRPDMFCVSKGVGGGFPLALLVYDRCLDHWQPGDHVGTFRGQEYAFRAGRATIETIQSENLLLRAATRGAALVEALYASSGCPGFGEVRGLGLYIGLECTACFGRSAGDVAKSLQASALRDHIVLERSGRENAVVRFLPPLTITDAEIARLGAAIARGFSQLQFA